MIRCAALAALVVAALPVPRDFTVVVHVDNGVGALTRAELSSLFLKKTTRWASGAPVVPVEITTSTVRESFCVAVHGKSVRAVKAYWNQLICSGSDVPPIEKTSDEPSWLSSARIRTQLAWCPSARRPKASRSSR